MPDEIFEAIRNEYERQVFAVRELDIILTQCGFSQREISRIIREGIKRKRLGVVSFRNVRRKPAKKRLLVIL